MNIKVSHVTISKWIKKFDKYFKSIDDELTKNLYLCDSDEWHADETVVKINTQKYYFGICIDSKTRFITSWNLNKSRETEQAFSPNNLIESFNKIFKSWCKKTNGLKSFESTNNLISNFIFYYNFIKSNSSLSSLTPTQVYCINSTHQEKVNWFIKY